MTTESALPDATRLAVDRTRLAHERTQMAWIRTATSLISFGFTLHKFFQYVRESQHVADHGLIGARGFALLMLGIGNAILIVAAAEHRRNLQALRKEYGRDIVPNSMATIVSVLVGVLGIAGLISVLFR